MDNVILLDTVRSTGRFERVLLGEVAEEGMQEPEVYIPGLLLKGQSHHFYGPSDSGKSWIAQWSAAESIQTGRPVVYLDLENGPQLTKERLIDALSLSPDDVDALLYYYPYLELALDKESKEWYSTLLLSFTEPGVIIFDSWLGFLSQAGLKEDSNDDLEMWASYYLTTASRLGWTTVLLDHTGHNGEHARGASRKAQVVQVQYQVKKKAPFDRTRVGTVRTELKKDRLAWLPRESRITLGGTPFSFELQYEGIEQGEYLPPKVNDALVALFRFGLSGATYTEWKYKSLVSMSPTTFENARTRLCGGDEPYVKSQDNRYYITEVGLSKVNKNGG